MEAELEKKELTRILLDNYKINKFSAAGESHLAAAQNTDGHDTNNYALSFKG